MNANIKSVEMIGPSDAIPTIPNTSLFLLSFLLNLFEIPDEIASKNGAEITPVVAPPASNAIAVNTFGIKNVIIKLIKY